MNFAVNSLNLNPSSTSASFECTNSFLTNVTSFYSSKEVGSIVNLFFECSNKVSRYGKNSERSESSESFASKNGFSNFLLVAANGTVLILGNNETVVENQKLSKVTWAFKEDNLVSLDFSSETKEGSKKNSTDISKRIPTDFSSSKEKEKDDSESGSNSLREHSLRKGFFLYILVCFLIGIF